MNLFALHLIDFYKSGHPFQMPEKTTLQVNNLTPRSSRLAGIDKMVSFGLQYFIYRYLIQVWNDSFFKDSKQSVVARYKRRMDLALGVGAVTTNHIEALHELGRLPLTILALPEGSSVPLRVPALVKYNTHPDFAWVVGYLETLMSNVLWGPCTSATIALEYRKLLNQWTKETGGLIDFVTWMGHDFSARGLWGPEAAAMSGAAHLLSFTGTDTVHALDFIEEYYHPSPTTFLGGSIPATEHSVMCMGGKAGEFETIKRLITKIYPGGNVSSVMDTWDLWHVIVKILPELKPLIMARDGRLVIRPDSGDPVEILCGPDYPVFVDFDAAEAAYWSSGGKVDIFTTRVDVMSGKYFKVVPQGNRIFTYSEYERTPAQVGVIELLYMIFGGTTNDSGFRQLDTHIGAIYGDSITRDRAHEICRRLAQKRFAATNVVLGIGSYTYQYNTRDTLGLAIKATYGVVDGEPRELFKAPITDRGDKKSAIGLLAVYGENGRYTLKEQATWEEMHNCAFEPVFVDGALRKIHTYDDIRARVLSMASSS